VKVERSIVGEQGGRENEAESRKSDLQETQHVSRNPMYQPPLRPWVAKVQLSLMLLGNCFLPRRDENE
jgi:hypothetical protein